MRNIVTIFVLAAPLAIVGCMAGQADETTDQSEQAVEMAKAPLPGELGAKVPGELGVKGPEVGPITAPIGGQAPCIPNPMAQAPGFQAPGYGAPSFPAPSFPAPTFGAPSY